MPATTPIRDRTVIRRNPLMTQFTLDEETHTALIAQGIDPETLADSFLFELAAQVSKHDDKGRVIHRRAQAVSAITVFSY